MTDVYIRIKRPDDYDDVAPEIVVEDFRAGQQRKEVWEWDVVAAAEPEAEDPELAAALGWPGGISDPVLDRKKLLGMVAALRVASPQPEAKSSALVPAALNALDLLMFYRDSWAKDCVDPDCADPECAECHRLRPLQLIIDDLRRALSATEEKQK